MATFTSTSTSTSILKSCRTCGIAKPLSDFTGDSKAPDGRSAICRDCQAARRRRRAVAKALATAAQALALSAPRATPESSMNTESAPPQTPPGPTPPVREPRPEDGNFHPAPALVAAIKASEVLMSRGKVAPNFVFMGPSGSGKTECAKWMAESMGLDFVHVDAPSMTDPESWFGTREVVVEDGAPRTEYHTSEFASAIQRPCLLLIDEGNRTSDKIRNILLSLWDGSRRATNPITGDALHRDARCVIVMTGNVGLGFTGTYAIDPAFLTRALKFEFEYLDAPIENRLAVARTGCTAEQAALFIRFANETRTRAKGSDEFPPVSTREVLQACDLVAAGLDATSAIRIVTINGAPSDGGGESVRAQLEMIWTGIQPKRA